MKIVGSAKRSEKRQSDASCKPITQFRKFHIFLINLPIWAMIIPLDRGNRARSYDTHEAGD